MKKSARYNLYDKLHKGVVITCIGMTMYSVVMLGCFGYDYYMNVKPQLMSQHEKRQKELLKEGSSETILDQSPELKL